MTAEPMMFSRTQLRHLAIDDSAPPRSGRESSQDLIGRVLQVLSLLVAWLLVYVTVLSGFEQNHAQARLYPELRTQLALGTAPTGAPIAAGAPVALISIPGTRVNDLVVVEGASAEALQDGPAHLQGSVLPGQAGVSVVLGRALSFGGPFAGIGDLRKGQRIRVTTGQGRFDYSVRRIRRAGDPMPGAVRPDRSRLVLVSTAGTGHLAGLRPGSTIYVDAKMTTKKAAAAGPVATLDPALSAVRGRLDTATLAQVALSLQLLVLSIGASLWAWRRWSRLGAWIAGIPVVIASLWLTSSLVSRLLPGLV